MTRRGTMKHSSTILISIKPEYAQKILKGEKRYEYRRITPSLKVKKMVIYATAPVSAVVGEAEIEGVLMLNASELWTRTKKYAGIDMETFYQYFSFRRYNAKAFQLGAVTRYEKPKSLENYGFKRPPQSWAYIKEERCGA